MIAQKHSMNIMLAKQRKRHTNSSVQPLDRKAFRHKEPHHNSRYLSPRHDGDQDFSEIGDWAGEQASGSGKK